MMKRRGSCILAVIFGSALLTAGCGGMVVHREDLDATGRIGLVSVVMPRDADAARAANRKILQEEVDYAAARVRTGLADVRPWKVLDAASIGGKAVRSFGKVPARDFDALVPQPDEQARARNAVDSELASWRERYIAAEGLPVIPREALAPDEEPDRKDPAIRPLMLQQVGRLCDALQVDAVAVAQVRYEISHPRENAFIVTEDRTDGLLAVSATLVIVDRTGRIIVDMGVRPVSRWSPYRDLLPLYRGAGKEAVAAANIDLADPKRKVQQAFSDLIDEAVVDLMDRLKEELGR